MHDQPAADAGAATSGEYEGAVEHYTSPGRRDAVKRRWEEPASRRVLDAAVRRIPPTNALRVLDVGCGTADGLALLRSTSAWRERERAGARLDYVGLDLDEHLLAVARRTHAGDPEVAFVAGDVRDGPPVTDAHLCVSSGVPYSHLTAGELEHALADLLAAARGRPHPVVVVVDVLGRYSVEWTTRWDRRRWSYRMSFFRGDDAPVADMSTYSGAELTAVVTAAADRAGCPLTSVTCTDRSVLVGRHTSTGEYTPGLPPYRELVNALYDPDAQVDLAALRFDLELPPAPEEISAFYADLADRWNALVDAARDEARAVGPDETATVVGPRLADRLRRLEASRQPGLGVGHSLTAVAVTRPSG